MVFIVCQYIFIVIFGSIKCLINIWIGKWTVRPTVKLCKPRDLPGWEFDPADQYLPCIRLVASRKPLSNGRKSIQ